MKEINIIEDEDRIVAKWICIDAFEKDWDKDEKRFSEFREDLKLLTKEESTSLCLAMALKRHPMFSNIFKK